MSAAASLGVPCGSSRHPGTLRERGDLRLAHGPAVDERRQRLREVGGRASLLDQLGERVVAQHQVGEDDRARLDQAPQRRRHDGIDLVGDHHRRAADGQLQRHGARCGERRTRQLEGAELVFLALDEQAAASATPAGAARSVPARDPTTGMTTSKRGRSAASCATASPNGPHQPLDLRAAAARQHDQQRRVGREPQALASGAVSSVGDPGQRSIERMADVAAGRPAQALVRGGLEGQQRQHMIDVGAHPARAARPPRPHAGRDVVDDGHVGARGAACAWRSDA